MVAPAAAGVKQPRGGHLAAPCRCWPCPGHSTWCTHVDALANGTAQQRLSKGGEGASLSLTGPSESVRYPATMAGSDGVRWPCSANAEPLWGGCQAALCRATPGLGQSPPDVDSLFV